MAVTELAFRVMASDAHVILVDAAPGAEGYARRRLEELEQRWSRFLPGSDISRLNGAPEALVFVSPDTVALLATMKVAWRLSSGRYDPTMLAAINAAGYTSSVDGSGRTTCLEAGSSRGATVADVQVDADLGTATVPAGLGLDPGGIGKGLAADIVLTELLEAGSGGALVGVGGDLAAAGTPPTGEGWYVGVEHPLEPTRDLMTLTVSAGGVATSSTQSRTWVQDGDRRHHVIDPRTGTSASTDLAAVTVVAKAGWEAETHATAALLGGAGRALDYFEGHGLEGLAVTLDGTTLLSPALQGAGVIEGSCI